MPRRDPYQPRIFKKDALAIAGLDYATYENLRRNGYLGNNSGRWMHFDRTGISRLILIGELWRLGLRPARVMEITGRLAPTLSQYGKSSKSNIVFGDGAAVLTLDMAAMARRLNDGLADLMAQSKDKGTAPKGGPLPPI